MKNFEELKTPLGSAALLFDPPQIFQVAPTISANREIRSFRSAVDIHIFVDTKTVDTWTFDISISLIPDLRERTFAGAYTLNDDLEPLGYGGGEIKMNICRPQPSRADLIQFLNDSWQQIAAIVGIGTSLLGGIKKSMQKLGTQ